jgi:hypothetical protein
MDESRLPGWIALNGAEMALAFLTFLHVLFALAFGLDFERYWSESSVDELENAEQLLRLGLVIGLPLAGAVFTSMQAAFLRRTTVHLPWWILAGPVGFVLPLVVIWPLTAIWGDIPGPVEPFTIVAGGLVGTAVLQWLALRRQGRASKRWLILWCVGLPLGMVAFMLVYLLLDTWLSIGWAGEVALIGFSIGGCAAALSGKPFLATVSPGRSAPA